MKLNKLFLTALTAAGLAAGVALAADGDKPTQAEQKATAAVQSGVQDKVQDIAREKRDTLIEEAVDALAKTAQALAALDKGNSDESLKLLAEATGKLEIVVAAHPDLAVAPVAVEIEAYDVYADLPSIFEARRVATHYLVDGRIQNAREIIEPLRSEMIIRVTGIPLATYPDAIKAVVPLIKEGKAEEAKAALQTALSTLVVEETVVPLPILRAQLLIEQAAQLAENKRSKDEQANLTVFIDAAVYQLALAEALGYGDPATYLVFAAEIAKVTDLLSDRKAHKGAFDKLQGDMKDFGVTYSSTAQPAGSEKK